MPVATETFSAVYDGETVTVAEGEFAVDGHELVRRYSTKFTATGKRRGPSIRGGRGSVGQQHRAPPVTARPAGPDWFLPRPAACLEASDPGVEKRPLATRGRTQLRRF